MASGRSHDFHGLVAAIIAALVVAACYWQEVQGVDGLWALPLGVLFGAWLLSPDLDLWNTLPTKRWGPLRFLWAPYSWACTHRGVSHSWILGPLSRLLYVGVPCAAIWGLGWEFAGIGPWVAFLAAGSVLGNWIHLLGDGLLPLQRR